MIRFNQVSLMRGVKPLLEQVDVTLNPGDKIGLIGANGAGKSSLFAMMRGELHPDQGDIDFPAKWRVAYVAQETPPLERAALDYAIDGDVNLRKLQAELERLETEPESTENGIAMGDLQRPGRRRRLHRAVARRTAAAGPWLLARPDAAARGQLLGGWRMRLNLAQALMCPSDLLLLDEPTNHLDLDAIIWLEDWLKRYTGTLLIISHDRDFLDEIVNVIVHIDERKLKRYSGNYSAFERQRAAQMALAAGALEKQQRKRAHRIVHRTLQGQGFQGPPGAEPHEGAGQDGRTGAVARRRRILVRIPRAAERAEPAAGDGRRRRRLPQRNEKTGEITEKTIVTASTSRCRSASVSACWV
jgi:ATP-binding cassette subfamily F protein 3